LNPNSDFPNLAFGPIWDELEGILLFFRCWLGVAIEGSFAQTTANPSPPPTAAEPAQSVTLGPTAKLHGRLEVQVNAAQAAAESARNLADFGEEQGPVTDSSKLDLESMARAYAAPGTGAFANFNSLVVDQLAQATKDIQRAKDLISFRVPFYPLVTIAANFSEGLNTAKNIDLADRVSLQLGAGVFSYLYTAYLLDKWYGLGADWGQLVKNNVLTFRNERALSFQLDSAKQNTLIAAAECEAKLGFVPDFVAYQFQLGNARREGDENAKLLALLNYWHATFYARLALQFGRS
jgi:hypothetical protein